MALLPGQEGQLGFVEGEILLVEFVDAVDL